MKKPEDESTSSGHDCDCRSDSPICYIHFSHPFVYIDTPAEIEDEDSNDCSSISDGESEIEIHGTEKDAGKNIPSVESLLPFERALEGPSRDLLTQILFPDLSKSEAQGSLSAVLKMLREAWAKSRPNSGSTIAPTTTTLAQQRQQKTTSRRRLSAPETRIRRFTVRTTTSTNTEVENKNYNSDNKIVCKSAPPIMCTDSIICQSSDDHNMISKYNNPCYCHTITSQNEFKFSCKLNFEENISTTTTKYKYNCNYIENNNRLHYNPSSINKHEYNNYVPKLIPRYSSLPRSLSMLANCSSPSTSTSSGSSSDNDEDCQSLADSLEDITRSKSRLTYDEKPVRGGPPLLPHRHAPRAPVPKGETFFIPLSDRNNELIPITSSSINNNEFILPQSLKEKLEKRKQELENRPKINRSVIVAQKSPRQVRSRRILGTKFQRFECIPEELEPRRGRRGARLPATRTYVPRAPLLSTANRGLQAIVRDNHEAKIGLQEMGISSRSSMQNKPGLQGILPITDGEENNIQDIVPLQRNKNNSQDNNNSIAPMNKSSQGIQGILPVPRGKQAMGEQDLVAVTTGWVNFYMLRGEEQSGVSSSDNTTGSGHRSRRSWSRGRSTTSRGASSVTEVSVSGRSSTVRVQQQPRPRTITQRRVNTADNVEMMREGSLPRLPPTSAGDRSTNGQQGTTLPSLSRQNVPMIRVKHPTNEDSSLTSENGSVSLPALPPALTGNASTSSSDTPRIRTRGKSSSSSSGPRNLSYVPSARRVPRQSRQLVAKPTSAALAESTPNPPGTWSVTVSGVCPQPEMEVRLVFPPTSDGTPSTSTPAVTNAADGTTGSEVTPAVTGQASQQSDSGLGEENNAGGALTGGDASRFTLMFKNNNENPASHGTSARGGRSSSVSNSRRGSPITSPKRRPSLKALPSTEVARTDSEDLSALDNMMWPEMQALLQEQVINIKKQHTITRGDVDSGALVERLRGGEGVEQIQQVQQVQQLSVRGAAITTRRKKRNTS